MTVAKKTTEPAKSPFDAFRERIRLAEKKHKPIGRVDVNIDTEGAELCVELLEEGVLPTKAQVLAQALAIGLRVLKNGSKELPPEAVALGTASAPAGEGETGDMGIVRAVDGQTTPMRPSEKRKLGGPGDE